MSAVHKLKQQAVGVLAGIGTPLLVRIFTAQSDGILTVIYHDYPD